MQVYHRRMPNSPADMPVLAKNAGFFRRDPHAALGL
jgi:hypothetical protein